VAHKREKNKDAPPTTAGDARRGRGAAPSLWRRGAGPDPPPETHAATRWDEDKEARRALCERRERVAEPVALDVTPENVLRHLARIAFYDPRNVYAFDGSLKRVNELDQTTAYALAGIDVSSDGAIVKYKLANRVPALEMLGKYLKLFEGELKDRGALDDLLAEFRKQYAVLTKEKPGDDEA